jgi:hypothetical protein
MTGRTRNYFMFIRISEDRYIDAFQKKGHIYCNTIQYFRFIEDNGIRGDKNEGKSYIKQVNNLEILFEGKIIAKAPNGQVYFEHPDDKGNIYCMYGVESNLVDLTKKIRQKIIIEDSTKEFGRSALLIHNPEEFLNRVSRKLKSLSLEFNYSPVYYYNPNTYEGELSPFYKSNNYSYQNEIRIWIPNKNEKPFEFYIGDISDISYKIPVFDLDKMEVDV